MKFHPALDGYMDGSSYHIKKFHPALDGYMDGSTYHIMKFHPVLDAYMDGSIYHIMKFYPSFNGLDGWDGWDGWDGHALFYVPICAPNCHLMCPLETIVTNVSDKDLVS